MTWHTGRLSAQGWNLVDLFSKLMPKPPEIVGSLHIQPKVGAVTAELAEPKRHFGSDGSSARHNPMQRLPRHTQQGRDFTTVCRPPSSSGRTSFAKSTPG
jgi:hypothetical protein